MTNSRKNIVTHYRKQKIQLDTSDSNLTFSPEYQRYFVTLQRVSF